MTNTTQTILLTESGDLEVYDGKDPEISDCFFTPRASDIAKRSQIKRTVEMPLNQRGELMDYLHERTHVTITYHIDVSDIVEIRDGLGYFKEPVREGESQEKLIEDLIEVLWLGFQNGKPIKEGMKAVQDKFTINRK